MLKATRSYIDGLANGLSEKENIKFKEGTEWKTDVKSKTIEYNPYDLQQLPADVVKGLLLHETGHAKYSDVLVNSKIGQENKSMEDVYNVLEDIRIENKLRTDYGAFATEGMQASTEATILTREKSIKDGDFKKKLPKLHQFLLNVMAKNYRREYQATSAITYYGQETMKRYSDDTVKQKLDDNEAKIEKIINNAKRAQSTKEIAEIADKELYPIIKDMIEEANKTPEPLHAKTKKETGINPSMTGSGSNDAKIPSDNDLELLLSPYINTLSRRLADVLKERMSTRLTGNYKHGKLQSKNAYKVLTDETRIFSKKKNPDTPHYVVSMLLDESGSMHGEPHANTYIGAYLIKRACEKLKFPVQFVQFDEYAMYNGTDLTKYRTDFSGGGNDEQKALAVLQQHIDKNDDNLIIMLTDGGAGSDPKPQIQQLTKEGASVIAIAIGLPRESGEVKQLQENYPVTLIADKVEELPRLMIDLLRGLVHR